LVPTDKQAAYVGAFNDGETAQSHTLTVHLDAVAVALSIFDAQDNTNDAWPLNELHVVGEAFEGAPVRLKFGATVQARLLGAARHVDLGAKATAPLALNVQVANIAHNNVFAMLGGGAPQVLASPCWRSWTRRTPHRRGWRTFWIGLTMAARRRIGC
jgi:hypothetical protein